MAKMSLSPKKSAEEFVKAANATSSDYPWNAPSVREDVIKAVSLRMPEEYIIKLQWLSEKTHKSQQEILREYCIPAIDEAIASIVAQ